MTSTILQLSEPFGKAALREAGLANKGKSPSVILIHGVGMQSAAWGPQIKAFSKSHHVIALDLPGHGDSYQIPSGSDLPVFLDWLLAVLDAQNLEHISLAGHSMGALIAGGFTACYPDRVERVALLNGVFRRDEAARQSVINRAKQISGGTFDLEAPLQRWFGDSPAERAVRADVAAWLSAVNIDGYATAYGAFARGDAIYADMFRTIACPLLALTGGDDPNSTPAMARAMADEALQGTAIIIDRHRHMVNLTAPDMVNAALLKWLNTPAESDGRTC